MTGKRSSAEFSWLGSWSEHKEGVSSVEPETRVNGLDFAAGWAVVGGKGAATEQVGGGGCTSSRGGWVRVGGGRSSRGIDAKSKEVLEVVSRRPNLGGTSEPGQ